MPFSKPSRTVRARGAERISGRSWRRSLFRRRIALPLDVRRVAQQRQHAFFAERAEAGQVDHAVFRGGVDLEVARHDDGADRRFDGERNGVGDGIFEY